MKRIEELEIEIKRNGKTTAKYAFYECPYCHSIVQKRMSDGGKANTCSKKCMKPFETGGCKFDVCGEIVTVSDPKGKFLFFTDSNLLEAISGHSWWKKSDGYSVTKVNNKEVAIHRVLTNAPKGMEVDHINRNKEDNRMCNLRICTRSQNAFNAKTSKKNKSGVIGVWFLNSKQKWIADIKINNRKYRLGYFDKKEDAIICRKKAEEKHFGEFKRYEDLI